MHPNTSSLSRRDALRYLGLAGAAALLPSFAAHAATEVPAATVPVPETLPNLAGDQPGYCRFKIGDFDAVALETDRTARMPQAELQQQGSSHCRGRCGMRRVCQCCASV